MRCAGLLVLLACLHVTPIAAQPPDLFPMQSFEKWGYINASGTWIIPPRYFWATRFHNGLAAVIDSTRRCWEFITPTGEVAFERSFCNNTGYFTETGAFVPTAFTGHFSEGLAPVITDQYSVVFINRQGETVISGDFEEAHSFRFGLARVKQEGRYGFIDTAGHWVIEPILEGAHDFSEGLAAVQVPSGDSLVWGYINTRGEMVIEPQFSEVGSYKDGHAWFKTPRLPQPDGYYPLTGFINAAGEVVIPPQFTETGNFSEGKVAVKVGWDWIYIDRKGKQLMVDTFEKAFPFQQGKAIVLTEMGYDVIDSTGKSLRTNPLLQEAMWVERLDSNLLKVYYPISNEEGLGSTGSDDFTYFFDAFMGYLDLQGNPIRVQTKAEINALRQIKAAAEVKARANEAAFEQEQLRRQREIMENCISHFQYGKETENFIEVNLLGKTRTIFFEKIQIIDRGNGGYELYFPPILMPGTRRQITEILSDPAAIQQIIIDPNNTFAPVRMQGKPDYPFDCLEEAASEELVSLFSSLDASFSYSIDSSRSKSLQVEVMARTTEGMVRWVGRGKPKVVEAMPTSSIQRLTEVLLEDYEEVVSNKMYYWPQQEILQFHSLTGFGRKSVSLSEKGRRYHGQMAPGGFPFFKIENLHPDSIIIKEYFVSEQQDGSALPAILPRGIIPKITADFSIWDTPEYLQGVVFSSEVLPLDMPLVRLEPDRWPPEIKQKHADQMAVNEATGWAYALNELPAQPIQVQWKPYSFYLIDSRGNAPAYHQQLSDGQFSLKDMGPSSLLMERVERKELTALAPRINDQHRMQIYSEGRTQRSFSGTNTLGDFHSQIKLSFFNPYHVFIEAENEIQEADSLYLKTNQPVYDALYGWAALPLLQLKKNSAFHWAVLDGSIESTYRIQDDQDLAYQRFDPHATGVTVKVVDKENLDTPWGKMKTWKVKLTATAGMESIPVPFYEFFPSPYKTSGYIWAYFERKSGRLLRLRTRHADYWVVEELDTDTILKLMQTSR